MTEYEEFNRTRDHPKFLLWHERGLAFDWAAGKQASTHPPTPPTFGQGGGGRERRSNPPTHPPPTHPHPPPPVGNTREKSLNISLTDTARQNGSIFAHVFFIREDFEWDEEEKRLWSYKRVPMNVYKKKPKVGKPPTHPPTHPTFPPLHATHPPTHPPTYLQPQEKKLKALLASSSKEEEQQEPTEEEEEKKEEDKDQPPTLLSFWKPELSLSLVHHFQAWPRASQLPGHLIEQVGGCVGGWVG